jgi:demethylmenaquinone methyltransferase/2-methoxy-6-polyprenyl-1,4-benzoquinol methylase
MLDAGRRQRPYLTFQWADALALPFEDNSFDLYTISFGLRNTHKTEEALAQALRVVRPGGRLVIVEFSAPTWRPFRTIYTNYLMSALPWIAKKTSSNPDAYIYLAESIKAWPNQAALAAIIEKVGWSKVEVRNLTGGIVAVHMAVKP